METGQGVRVKLARKRSIAVPAVMENGLPACSKPAVLPRNYAKPATAAVTAALRDSRDGYPPLNLTRMRVGV